MRYIAGVVCPGFFHSIKRNMDNEKKGLEPDSGVSFRNTRRETDKHPEYTGSALIDGVEYWVSTWVNTSKDGNTKYFSHKYKRKDQQPAKPAPAPPPPAFNIPDPIDDLPF